MPRAQIPSGLLRYLTKNIYEAMGDADEVNSAKALHGSTSGPLAGLPVFTHKTRAIFALIMCARWGADAGPVDKDLNYKLQELVGPDLAFACNYLGAAARFVAVALPSFPKDRRILTETIAFKAVQEREKKHVDLSAVLSIAALKGMQFASRRNTDSLILISAGRYSCAYTNL